MTNGIKTIAAIENIGILKYPVECSYPMTFLQYSSAVLSRLFSIGNKNCRWLIRAGANLREWGRLSWPKTTLRCILDFERSRNQRQGSEFSLGKWNS